MKLLFASLSTATTCEMSLGSKVVFDLKAARGSHHFIIIRRGKRAPAFFHGHDQLRDVRTHRGRDDDVDRAVCPTGQTACNKSVRCKKCITRFDHVARKSSWMLRFYNGLTNLPHGGASTLPSRKIVCPRKTVRRMRPRRLYPRYGVCRWR
jgi:hypothetical protein